jgi:hypothetical protein
MRHTARILGAALGATAVAVGIALLFAWREDQTLYKDGKTARRLVG